MNRRELAKNGFLGRLKVFLVNFKSFHHRLMMRYLRKRGWVVFYLEKQHRKCVDGTCWLNLYDEQGGGNG